MINLYLGQVHPLFTNRTGVGKQNWNQSGAVNKNRLFKQFFRLLNRGIYRQSILGTKGGGGDGLEPYLLKSG